MNCPGHHPWVSGRVVASAASLAGVAGGRRWRASLAGVTGGRRWRASLAGVAGGAAQKHREIQLRRLKHHTPPKCETRTAHFERRQHARDKQPSADKRHRRFPITARARAKTTKKAEPANRGMTRQRSRVIRHAKTQPQTGHQTRKNRREPIQSFWEQPGTQANQTKESRLRPPGEGGDQPHGQPRPTDPLRDSQTTVCDRTSASAADQRTRDRWRTPDQALCRLTRTAERRQPAVSATARACRGRTRLRGRERPPTQLQGVAPEVL